MKKMSIKKDDLVVVLSGKDKGKQGDQGGSLKKEAPLYAGKVQKVCPKCNKPTRIGHKVEGDKKVRICKKCGAEI